VPSHQLFGLPAWVPISIIGFISWSMWLLRQYVGAGYRPLSEPQVHTTSLIVPVYREDLAVLETCMGTWLANSPDEVILVIDVSEGEIIEHAERWGRENPRIRSIIAYEPGKRHALCLGMRAATSEVVVLTDSDTVWEGEFIANLLMGFGDPHVAGVGCRQNVFQPGDSLWRRVADWMLDVRFLHFIPATARYGSVPCISGRTAAYRRQIVTPMLDELEHETFFGRPCISGDDGRLTWLVLREGWKAGYQSSARALTVFPNSFSGFVKQRVRWSRNSYRCYFRAIGRGWLWRQPVITSISVLQNLIGPFTLTLVTALLVSSVVNGDWAVAFITSVWLLIGRSIKGIGHLVRDPMTIVFLPVITIVFIAVMIPVKFFALFTLNKQGWITRTRDEAVAVGQGADTLDLPPSTLA
jgi:hyaluronan synthase